MGINYAIHRENCVSFNLVQEFIEIEAWLLLTFFLCLDNQSISVHSIFMYQKLQMFEKCDSSNREKLTVSSFKSQQRITAKFELVFVSTQENAFAFKKTSLHAKKTQIS